MGWNDCARLVGMCLRTIRTRVCASWVGFVCCGRSGLRLPLVFACVCLVRWPSRLCEKRWYVPGHRGCVYVCLLLGLSLLCKTRRDEPAHFACVYVPRAWSESIVRDSRGCAFLLCVCASCPVIVFWGRLARMCLPTVRACVFLVPWLSLL